MSSFSTGWRRRRRKRRRRRRPWSRPARAPWHALKRRSRGAAGMTTRRTRRASWTPSSSFCPGRCRTCSRSKSNEPLMRIRSEGRRDLSIRDFCGAIGVGAVRRWCRRGIGGSGGRVLAKLLEATHCLSRSLCSFLLHDNGVVLPSFYLPQLLYVELPLAHFLQWCFLSLYFCSYLKKDWGHTLCIGSPDAGDRRGAVFSNSDGTATMFSGRRSMLCFFPWLFSTFLNLTSVFILLKTGKKKSAFEFLGHVPSYHLLQQRDCKWGFHVHVKQVVDARWPYELRHF